MPNPDLQNYITQSRQQGMTDDQIRQNLVGQGWQQADLDQAFGVASSMPITSQAPISVISSSTKMAMTTKIILIGIGVVIIVGGSAFGYFKFKNKTASAPVSQTNSPVSNSVSSLTAEKIKNLKTSSNDQDGDYFIASPGELKTIVSAFVADNSKSDPTYLYVAANTAYRIGEIKEAAFLLYAAQIRKAFDYKRYGLGAANGNNIQTYWGFLNQTTGQLVNPAIAKDPKAFSEVADMISKWQVIPTDNAYYPADEYGSYVLPREQWSALAEQIKQDFKTNFFDKFPFSESSKTTQTQNTEDTLAAVQLRSISTALELYHQDYDIFPTGQLEKVLVPKYLTKITLQYGYAYMPKTNPQYFQVWTQVHSNYLKMLDHDSDINSTQTGWYGDRIDGSKEGCAGGIDDCILDYGEMK